MWSANTTEHVWYGCCCCYYSRCCAAAWFLPVGMWENHHIPCTGAAFELFPVSHTQCIHTPPTHRHAFTYTQTHTYKTRLASLAAGGKVAIRKFNSTNLIFHHPVKSVRSRARHHRTTWKGAFSTVRLLPSTMQWQQQQRRKTSLIFLLATRFSTPFLPPVPNFTTVALRRRIVV